METDILVRTTTTDGRDLRYMTAGRVTDAVATEREQMAATSDENPFQNPPINDRSTGICYSSLGWNASYFSVYFYGTMYEYYIGPNKYLYACHTNNCW